MGFLSMIGAVSAEDHNRIVAKKDKLIADADSHMKGEDFAGVDDHPGRVALIMARLRASRSRVNKAESELSSVGDRFKNAISDLAAAQEEIARLKPLAEATERRRANDAKRVRPSRAKKAAGK